MLDLFGPLEMFSLLGTEVVEILTIAEQPGLLAKAGISDGHKATSNKQFFSLAVAQSDKVEWIEEAEYTWHEDADSDPFVAYHNESADLMP